MSTRYLDPTNDIAFKKVFGDETRLRKLLNAIMRLPENREIIELEYIPNEQVPDLGQLKRSIVDIKCRDKSGNSYIVEMQNGYAESFLKRTQYYASTAITTQVARGKTYAEIAPVILVAIVNHFKPLKDDDLDVITFHRTVEVQTGKQYLKDLSYVFVELDRFQKTESELENFEDHWLYFLAKSDQTVAPPKQLHDKDILSAYETINEFNWTPSELDAYIKAKLASDTEILNLEAKYNKGKSEGITEGIEIGEARAAQKIAINMIKSNIDLKLISAATGLSAEQISQLTDLSLTKKLS